VTLSELPSSVRVVESGTRLLRAGVLSDDPMFISDHYDTVLVARDPWLLDRLRQQALAPLADLPATTRQRLEDTLAAWLTAMGDGQAAARALQVHPQTVRYRLRQLNDLFGAALSDPASRLRLTLALCWNVPGSLPVGSAR
jgi:DNA-binding PucR family transcriptional regulator